MESEYACEVVPRIFFGPAGTTYDKTDKSVCSDLALPSPDSSYMNHFTHIVNCDTYMSSTSQAGQLKRFLFLPSYDDEFRILDTHFNTLFDFLKDAFDNPLFLRTLRPLKRQREPVKKVRFFWNKLIRKKIAFAIFFLRLAQKKIELIYFPI